MPRKPKKFNFIYKTTNQVTNRYYIGMHSTDDMNDGYLGSGRVLSRSILKYGEANHIREILEYANNRCDLRDREKIIVNSETLTDSLCMNLAVGGEGGSVNKWSDDSRKKLSDTLKIRPNTWGNKVGDALRGKRNISDEAIQRAANSRRGERNGSWIGVNLEQLRKYRFDEMLTIAEIHEKMQISYSTIKRKLKQLGPQ